MKDIREQLADALDDQQVRAIIHGFSVGKAEGPHSAVIRHLAAKWSEYNARHFEGRLTPAYISISEPKSPRAIGDCGKWSGHGGRAQIRIRPSHADGTVNRGKVPAPGRTVRFMREGHAIELRLKWLEDILIHEMIHQYEQEVLGTDGCHGRDFTDQCNMIGAELGLPPVVVRRRKGDPRNLQICSQWPHNVRPVGYYGNLWAEATAEQEDDDDPVSRLIALFLAMDPDQQAEFMAHPAVASINHDMPAAANGDAEKPEQHEPVTAPEPDGPRAATTNGAYTDADVARVRKSMVDKIARGIKQVDFAKFSGVIPMTISRFKKGRRINDEALAKIEAALDMIGG